VLDDGGMGHHYWSSCLNFAFLLTFSSTENHRCILFEKVLFQCTKYSFFIVNTARSKESLQPRNGGVGGDHTPHTSPPLLFTSTQALEARHVAAATLAEG
jgi:hypothetical protein